MERNLTNFQISEIQRVLERWKERVPVKVLSIKTEIISKNITDVTIKHWNTDHKNFLVIVTHYSVHRIHWNKKFNPRDCKTIKGSPMQAQFLVTFKNKHHCRCFFMKSWKRNESYRLDNSFFISEVASRQNNLSLVKSPLWSSLPYSWIYWTCW